MGVSFIAEQLCALKAQLQNFGDQRVVVGGTTHVAAVVVGVPDFFTQLTICGVGQERLHRGTGIVDDPFAFHIACFGCCGGRGDIVVRQTFQIIFAVDDRELIALIIERVLTELGVQRRQALIDFGKLGFLFFIELGASANKAGVVQPGQALFFWRQLGFFFAVVNGFNALEQFFVLSDFILERGELWRQRLLDFWHFAKI